MAEENEMSTSDALNEIGRFENVFRAAERIREVLAAASNMDGRKAELETAIQYLEGKKAGADDEAKKAAENLARMLDQFESARKDLEAKLTAAKQEHEVVLHDLGEKLSRDSVAARDRIAGELKSEQDKVDALAMRRGDLERDVRELEEKVKGLQLLAEGK